MTDKFGARIPRKSVKYVCWLVFIIVISIVFIVKLFNYFQFSIDLTLLITLIAAVIASEVTIFQFLVNTTDTNNLVSTTDTDRDGNEQNRPGPVYHNIRKKNSKFFDRKELEEIRAAFETDEIGCVIQAIAGRGGIGKTQLAAAYVHKFKGKYTDGICWVDVNESLRTTIFDFLKKAGIVKDEDELKDDEIIWKLNGWFEDHTSFLFIFDNVENAEDIKPYISHINNGHVLITTQDTHLDSDLDIDNTIILRPFNEEDARTFILQWLLNGMKKR